MAENANGSDVHVLEMIVFDKGVGEGADGEAGVRGRFEQARAVAQAWTTEGMHAQWWGQAIERPQPYFWLLQWNSVEAYRASRASAVRARVWGLLPASPSITTTAPASTSGASPLASQPGSVPALPPGTAPPHPVSGNGPAPPRPPTTSTPFLLRGGPSPAPLLRAAPIVEFSRFWIHDAVPVDRAIAALEGFHAEMGRLREEAARGLGRALVGSRGWTGGFGADLDANAGEGEGGGGEMRLSKEGVHMAGWESVEDHMQLGQEDERFLAAFEETAMVLRRLEMWHVALAAYP
ncbi:hypothetical protein OF83DRAFT_705402 [Amylostereum chailletii]|nr:hypothetical protein OF83DRAFT_705402 [Amylostereum chailletii]